jgi:hypothetical protein
MVGRNIAAAYTKHQLLHEDEFAMNMPECDSNGRHLGFFDWYENWLDSGIAARADLLSP